MRSPKSDDADKSASRSFLTKISESVARAGSSLFRLRAGAATGNNEMQARLSAEIGEPPQKGAYDIAAAEAIREAVLEVCPEGMDIAERISSFLFTERQLADLSKTKKLSREDFVAQAERSNSAKDLLRNIADLIEDRLDKERDPRSGVTELAVESYERTENSIIVEGIDIRDGSPGIMCIEGNQKEMDAFVARFARLPEGVEIKLENFGGQAPTHPDFVAVYQLKDWPETLRSVSAERVSEGELFAGVPKVGDGYINLAIVSPDTARHLKVVKDYVEGAKQVASARGDVSIKTVSRTKIKGGKPVSRRMVVDFQHPLKRNALIASTTAEIKAKSSSLAAAAKEFQASETGRSKI